jgi:hypothetical protein
MRRISQGLQGARPTMDRWMPRFERDQAARGAAKSAAPHTPARQVRLPVRLEMSHRPKRPPDAGGVRLWRLRGHTDRAGRPVARSLALNRQGYPERSGTAGPPPKAAPQPPPCTASAAPESWFLDGRMRDVALEGPRWWSLSSLDGASRPLLAGAVAPSEASGGALTVL